MAVVSQVFAEVAALVAARYDARVVVLATIAAQARVEHMRALRTIQPGRGAPVPLIKRDSH